MKFIKTRKTKILEVLSPISETIVARDFKTSNEVDLEYVDFGDDGSTGQPFNLIVQQGTESETIKINGFSRDSTTGEVTFQIMADHRDIEDKPPYAGSETGKNFLQGAELFTSNDPETMSRIAQGDDVIQTLAGEYTFTGKLLFTGNSSDPESVLSRSTVEAMIASLNVGSGAVVNTSSTAGEAISAQKIVRFKATDGKLYLADKDDATIGADTLLAYSHSAVANNGTTVDGIILTGQTLLTGLTAGKKYLGVNGAIADTGDIYIGTVGENGVFVMDGEVIKQSLVDAQNGNVDVPSSINTFQTEMADVLVVLNDEETKTSNISGAVKTSIDNRSLDNGYTEISFDGEVQGLVYKGSLGDFMAEAGTTISVSTKNNIESFSLDTQNTQSLYDDADMMDISPDGKHLFMQRNGTVMQYTFATAGDYTSTLTYIGNKATGTNDGGGLDVKLHNGDYVIFVGGVNESLKTATFNATTENITNATIASLNLNVSNNAFSTLSVSEDGKSVIGLAPRTSTGYDTMISIQLTTPFDITGGATIDAISSTQSPLCPFGITKWTKNGGISFSDTGITLIGSSRRVQDCKFIPFTTGLPAKITGSFDNVTDLIPTPIASNGNNNSSLDLYSGDSSTASGKSLVNLKQMKVI